MDSWLKSKRGDITDQSWKDYEITIRLHLKPAFGSIPVQRFTTSRIQQQYNSWLDEGKSNRLIRGCHMRLNQALEFGVKQGLIVRNSAQQASVPKILTKKFDVWNPDQVNTFLEASREDPLHPLWYLLVLEGLRRGEALGLRWRDVNWDRGTIHISQTVTADKNDRGKAIIQPRTKTSTGSRSVRLSDPSLEALRQHWVAQAEHRAKTEIWEDNDLVNCTRVGTPVNPNNVTRSYNRIVKRTSLPRIRVHDLRHTSATLLLLQGVPAKVVSERLGHATVGITLDLYSHVLPDMQEDAARKMSDLFLRASGADTR